MSTLSLRLPDSMHRRLRAFDRVLARVPAKPPMAGDERPAPTERVLEVREPARHYRGRKRRAAPKH